MPRKEWVPRNPYCRRSRLDKIQFELLLGDYFGEILYRFTRRNAQVLKDSKKNKHGAFLSRQSISCYFKRISQYIWNNIVIIEYPSLQDKKVLDEFFDLFYGKINKISKHTEIFNSFNKSPLYTDARNIANSFIFYLLWHRSIEARGIKRDFFYLEFSRVYFICGTMDKIDVDYKTLYLPLQWSEKQHLEVYSRHRLRKILEENPM